MVIIAENYITQNHTWVTGQTMTAARLNGNISNIIDGLDGGVKAINIGKLLINSLTTIDNNRKGYMVDLDLLNATNDGNPLLAIGATTSEVLNIQSIFDGGAQTLDYALFQTKTASATANKGQFKFEVDEASIFNVTDGGISLQAGMDLIGSSTSDITFNTNKFTVAGATGNTVVGGTLDVTGAIGATASITLGAGADLIGSSTSDITFNTNKFTVAGATGNTAIAGTLDVTGAIGATASITLGAGADLIGSATSDITFNTNKFTVAGATGNTVIAGTLDVTGVGTFTAQSVHTNGLTDGTATLDGSGAWTGIASAVITGNLTVDTNTLFVDSTNNRVGIGTSSPDYTLEVEAAAGGAIVLTDSTTPAKVGFTINDSQGFSGTRTNHAYGLTVNDSVKVTIDTAGYVGIGVTNPSTSFEVRRDADDTLTRMAVHNNNAGTSALTIVSLGNDTNGSAAGLRLASSVHSTYAADEFQVYQGLNAPLVFMTSGTTRMTINGTGDTYLKGQATGNPKFYFERGDGSAMAYIQNTVTGGTGGNITLYAAGSSTGDIILTPGSSGGVGIGVADPDTPLEVFSTSSQLKLSYDATYFATTGVSSDGTYTVGTADASMKLKEVGTEDTVLSLESTSNTSATIPNIANALLDYRAAWFTVGKRYFNATTANVCQFVLTGSETVMFKGYFIVAHAIPAALDTAMVEVEIVFINGGSYIGSVGQTTVSSYGSPAVGTFSASHSGGTISITYASGAEVHYVTGNCMVQGMDT